MVRKTILIALIALCGTRVAAGQTLVLDSILGIIEKNNPELKAYDSKITAYTAYATGAKAYEPPQLGAGFFMTPYNAGMWNEDLLAGSPGMGSFMISAQQMFTHPQKLRASARYMQSMANVDQEMSKAMRNELYSMAKMNYYEWMILKKKLAVLKESEELLSYIIKSAEIRYTYGMDPLTAYYKAKAMLGDIKNMRLMIEYEIRQKRIALNTLMNRDKETLFDIDTVYAVKDYDLQPVDTSQIHNNRSDLKALDQGIHLLTARQNYERSKLKPDFGLKYDHMIAFGAQPQQFSLMAMVTIPIAPWSSKMYKSSVKGLDLEIEAVKYQQQALLNNTGGSLHSYKEQIKSKKQQLELYDKSIVPSMKKNHQVTLIAYEQGKEELYMVLDAWQNLKLVQLSRLDLLNELLQLQISYEKELEIK
ncbi:MAG: TolC family protein [Bacteroidota bacterium]